MPRSKDERDADAVTTNEPNRCEQEFGLIQDSTMSGVINTGASSPPSPNGRTKLSACYELKRGAEVAAQRVGQGCGKYWSSTCSVATLKKTFPIINWLPNYRLKTLKCDFIAGLTVGLTVIPQAMAYAALAGLELQVSCVCDCLEFSCFSFVSAQ